MSFSNDARILNLARITLNWINNNYRFQPSKSEGGKSANRMRERERVGWLLVIFTSGKIFGRIKVSASLQNLI